MREKAVYAVNISGLRKEYKDKLALDSVNLKVKRGELFGLLGPNGAGKTTIIKAITGQIKPDKGDIVIEGINAIKEPIKVREISGIVPEQESPPSFLSAEEYLHFVANLRRVASPEKRIRQWLEYLSFSGERDVLAKNLSRGTRQKLMIAQAFLHDPRIAFIDEPLINLDPLMQQKVKKYFKKFVKDGGTVFLSTHVLEIAEEICSRVAIIDKGKIIHEGSLGEIKKKKKHLQDFFLSLVKD